MEEHINKKIVKYIKEEWVDKAINNSAFAVEHLIDEKTVRQIKSNPDYRISLITIIRICYSRKISLEKFFKLVGV